MSDWRIMQGDVREKLRELLDNWEIRQGDVREVLSGMADESVHCIVTSPPYW